MAKSVLQKEIRTPRVTEFFSTRWNSAITSITERYRAAILHDIGKIGIEDAILRKVDILTGEEELAMRKHPEIGARILSYVDEMRGVVPGVLYHHERFDGSGYPEGLRGDGIPLNAGIIAVAGAFDALTTDRPCRKSVDMTMALEELMREGGTHFDPVLAGVFNEGVKKRDVS